MRPRQEILDTVAQVAVRWQDSDTEVLRAIFPLLANGTPVRPSDLARHVGTDRGRLRSALAFPRIGWDNRGRITELFGVTLRPTAHRIVVEGMTFFTCCAVVAHMIPSLVGRSADVESVDPVTGGTVRLTVTAEAVTRVDPKPALATWVATQGDRIADHVGGELCVHVKHFEDAVSAAAFCAQSDRRFSIRLDELHEASRLLYDVVWAPSRRQGLR